MEAARFVCALVFLHLLDAPFLTISCALSVGVSFQYSVSGGACTQCPIGQFSPGNVSGCTNCSAGTFASVLGTSSCSGCPAGTASGAGASGCTNCTAGRWSASANSSSCTDCPAGNFSNTRATSCPPCPAGSVSSSGSPTCSVCGPGQYTAVPQQSSCIVCTAGTLSTGNTSACTNCSAGQFSLASSGMCSVCPAGTYSSSGAGACLNCSAGQYSVGGADNCSLCLAGRYGDAPMLSVATCSGNCSAGYYCPAGSDSPTEMECPAGQFSVAGASSCSSCTAGRYGNASAATSSLCSGLCAAGYFGASPGLTVATCSGECAAGYFCVNGSTNATSGVRQPGRFSLSGASSCSMCPGGRYGLSFALTSSSCSGTCTPGHYCPEGSVDLVQCAAGKWSNASALSVPCEGVCDPGYLCVAGSSTPRRRACGFPKFYCPAGTTEAQVVSAGYYSTGGSEDTRSSQTLCPGPSSPDSNFSAVYCLGGVAGDGTLSVCPGGVFGNTSGLSAASCSGRCSAGYYCPPGSVNGTAQACGGVNWYCPAGVGEPVAVPLGHYSLPDTDSLASFRSGFRSCMAGEYCDGGLRYLCAGGRYSTSSGRATPCTDECVAGELLEHWWLLADVAL